MSSAFPESIRDLVERFDEQKDAYKNPAYNETQVRRDFIDPFFAALGWDVDNTKGYAEAYRDVIHEDRVLVGKAKKAPDYSFRIGGQRKFFVEAKKPSVPIATNPEPAFQVRRYGWSAGLPVCIVTDFEEFAVYDTTIKPRKSDTPGKARLFYCTYDQYAEKWDEISGLFSQESILRGAFDRFNKKKRRGTETVDEAFLEEIEAWRSALAKDIFRHHPGLSIRDLNQSVQAIIDRIVFLRICEDRGIEPEDSLQKLATKPNIYKALVKKFRDADAKYNSGLFHFSDEKGRETEVDTLTPTLKIDDDALKDIIASLYYPNPYEFSVLPADILGQVYERFLGKVITLDENGVEIEEKPEVRKAGGVYYTPSYIVDYIVRHTVGELVKDKTPAQVEKLRVVDPACGSGSFLIVAYQYLLDWHLAWYQENQGKRGTKDKIYPNSEGVWRLTIAERKRILLNNIYGVDIDRQAVEVTKLSLLLKVLEGESQDTVERQLSLFKERALPDLASNIKCGNSLIGSDFYAQENLPELLEEDHYRLNVFDWEDAFPEVFAAGGFDAVIGNPPYGASLYQAEKQFFSKYFQHQSYQLDTYLLFMEHSVKKLLRKDGLWGMIIPNPWLTNIRQDSIRAFLLSNTAVSEIVHFTYPVFKAVVDTEILLFRNGGRRGNVAKVLIVKKEPEIISDSQAQIVRGNQDAWLAEAKHPLNIFLNTNERELRNKAFSLPCVVSKYFDVNVGIKPYQKGKGIPKQTEQDVEARAFDADRKIGESYRQYLRGKDIVAYRVLPIEQRFIKYGEWLAEPRPAANFDAPEKIFVRQTGDSVIAAYDDQQLLCLNNMHVLVPKPNTPNIKGILAVLNSKLLTWCLRAMNPEAGEALAEVKKDFVERLPLPDAATLTELNQLAVNIMKLPAASSATSNPQLKGFLRRVDQIVYQLYGLTEDEIRIVEESA